MKTFLTLFGPGEAGKPASPAEMDSLGSKVANHKEDASQGGEFLDDEIWETDPTFKAESQQDFDTDANQ
ncbi:hypothetical protein ACFQ4C_08645 [Larkinella insperata]|uniref:Uncharacterized protein n=1 Tax=Larkinella insperata TaxID=332158 RepID=A0ABW3Q3Z4_9BACT